MPFASANRGPPHGNKFDHTLGGISWPFCPAFLARLIPSSREDFADRSLNVVLLD